MDSLTRTDVLDEIPRGLRVTVVDDHAEFLDMMTVLLNGDGHAVAAFEGATAVDEIAASDPDVLVVDLLLPTDDGAGALGRLRSHPRLRHVPIVVCTAYVRAVRELGEVLGAMEHVQVIEKPFEISEMQAAIARAAGQRSA